MKVIFAVLIFSCCSQSVLAQEMGLLPRAEDIATVISSELSRQAERSLPVLSARIDVVDAKALKHLHARGILHGDLYAHNILWNPVTGEAVLSDFGAAMLSNTLPPADRALLQAIEWRAFAHLEVEIAARTSS